MADEFTKAALYWIKTFNKKVKEKIWIEKLIELANQYEIEKEKSEWVNVDVYIEFRWEWVWEWYLNKWLTRYDETDHWEWDNLYWDTAVAYLISKSFGMVKWLVENDKIDTKKVAERRKEDWWSIVNYNHYEEQMTRDIRVEYWVDNTLMALSISDTPIEDLLLYLK